MRWDVGGGSYFLKSGFWLLSFYFLENGDRARDGLAFFENVNLLQYQFRFKYLGITDPSLYFFA